MNWAIFVGWLFLILSFAATLFYSNYTASLVMLAVANSWFAADWVVDALKKDS